MMRELAEGGGKVIWAGPPPVLDREGKPVLEEWEALFGIDYSARTDGGLIAPGRLIHFEGALASVEPQMVLTDLLVDRLHPVTPREGAETVATTQAGVVGTLTRRPSGGTLTYLGFRPRDDQSQSLGYDVRTLYGILDALGAYPASGRFAGVDDNTETLSRTGGYLTCRFPNGAVSIAPHLRQYSESWPGGFARKAEEDARYLEQNPLPPAELHLNGVRVNGHEVTCEARGPLTFRVNAAGDLIAFAGQHVKGITVDGREWRISDAEVGTIAWAPVQASRRVENGAVLTVYTDAAGEVRIPAAGLPPEVDVFAEGPAPGSKGAPVPHRMEGGALILSVPEGLRARFCYVVAR
jgi:hypothetical protein